MRKTFLSLAAASVIALGALPAPAHALGIGSAHGIRGALADIGLVEQAAYVCRHRHHSSRRVCWWTPDRHHHHRQWHRKPWHRHHW
jgi:hypothetical protein